MNNLRRRVWCGAFVLLLAVGLWQVGEGLYIYAKARLAQQLIGHAWDRSREQGAPVRPWPWADTQPTARLGVAAHGIDLYVLEGDSGRSLAYDPGHMTRTALPGKAGNAVIAAHRDTHFSFLEQIRAGEELMVQSRDGGLRSYRVREMAVVDQTRMAITLDSRAPTLTLVTCYPFNALSPQGPLRYVVTAVAVGD